jgi:hypothetical protein
MSDQQIPRQEPSGAGPGQPQMPPPPSQMPPQPAEAPPPPFGPTATAGATAPPPRKRKMGLIAGAIVVALAIVGGVAAFAILGGSDEGGGGGGTTIDAVSIAFAYSEGQSETFLQHMTMTGQLDAPDLGFSQPIDMDVTQTMTWEVVSVDDQGVATIEVSQTDMTGTVNGTEVPAAGVSEPIQMQIAPDGRILSAGGMSFANIEQTSGASFPGMGQVTPLLPDGPVEPGDTWTKHFSQDMPFGEGTITFDATSTLEGYEDVDGVDAAVVSTQYTVPLNFTLDFADLIAAMGDSGSSTSDLAELQDASIAYGGQGTFSMKSWVDTDAKEMLKSSSSGSFDMTMEFTGVPGVEGQLTFTGEFTQDVEKQ